VISVSGQKDTEAQPVHALNRLGGRNKSQVWRVIYTDKMGDESIQKKGKRDTDYNFRVLEPFYLRSRLPMQRVMEAVGANNVVIKRWVKNKT